MAVDIGLCRKVADAAEGGELARHNQIVWLGGVVPDETLVFTGAEGSPVSEARVMDLAKIQCGTGGSACLAGYTALMTAPEGTKTDGRYLFFPDGGIASVKEYAREQLGLSLRQQDIIFGCLDDARAIRMLRGAADEAERRIGER